MRMDNTALSRRSFLRAVAGSAAAVHFSTGSKTAEAASPYQIIINSYPVADTPFGQAVHHELVFMERGEVFQVLNGYPFDRLTGLVTNGIGDNNTLRAVHDSEHTYGKLLGVKPLSSAVLWEGNMVEFYDKLQRSREAATYINSQKMDYSLFEFLGTAQNSNSVAYTITQAMGLKYPAKVENMWAPGHGRYLMPEKFESFFDRYSVTSQSFYDFLGAHLQGKAGRHNRYTDYIFDLGMKKIGETVRAEGIDRRGQGTRFYNPHNPEIAVRIGADYYDAQNIHSVLVPAP